MLYPHMFFSWLKTAESYSQWIKPETMLNYAELNYPQT